MQQELSEIYFYLKGTLKYKRVAILFALLVCSGAWSYVFLMEDKYESKAKVHIDSATVIRPLMRGMVIEPDVNSLIRIIQQLMFTRPNLEKIAQVAQLDPLTSGGGKPNISIDELKNGIVIKGGDKSEIYDIAFTSNDPEQAKTVVQAVLTIFSEQTQGKAMSDADDAQRFIEQQIRDYEQRLQQAEKAKEEFKRTNIDLLSTTDQFTSLQQMKIQLEDANTALKQAVSRRDVLAQQIKEVEESGGNWGADSLSKDNSVVAGDNRIESLKDKRAQLLVKFTERHPEVLEIDKLIESLSQEQIKQVEESAQKTPNNTDAITPQKMANPYVQSLKMAFNSAEAEVASAQALASSIQARISKSEQDLNRRLTVETEMKNLNRDYETISSNYAQLLGRREQVHITESVDDKTSRLKFKIADPPTKATKPSYPNRQLLYSLILVGGCISGFAVAFLIYFLRPVFMSNQQLRYVTGLPSLGSISLTSQGITRSKHIDWVMYSTVASLLLSYAGVMIIEILK